jgi:hypothetical protein
MGERNSLRDRPGGDMDRDAKRRQRQGKVLKGAGRIYGK